MTDTVNTNVTQDGQRNYVVVLQNVSDGTGESAVKKVDISTLLGSGTSGNQNAAPVSFAVKEIEYDIQGFSSVRLFWDATTDDEMAILSGQGYFNFDPPFADPRSTGFTGDVMLTTAGAVSGATYTIKLWLLKKS